MISDSSGIKLDISNRKICENPKYFKIENLLPNNSKVKKEITRELGNILKWMENRNILTCMACSGSSAEGNS